MSWLTGRKTYIVGIVTILYAVAQGWESGDWNTAFTLILAALGGMGLRAGVAKNGTK